MAKTVTTGNNSQSGKPERGDDVEMILADELALADRALRGVPPVLTHMLASSRQTLVSDAIVARLRGILTSLSAQLIAAMNETAKPIDNGQAIDQLTDLLAGDSVVLSYCYALAMEAHLTERLEHRASIDPVVSLLLQELIASDNPQTAELAMTALAAQSRFIQSQRRMDLPLSELPADLFQTVLKRWEKQHKNDPKVADASKRLKAQYDEGATRVGLLARLISSMKGGAIAALELEHAGLGLFVTALSMLSKQPRELSILACHEQQTARLVLSLRAAGASAASIERQFLILEPVDRLPGDIATLAQDRAAALLKQVQTKGRLG
ncbi:hypothetical protein [Erythrobacter sp. F6033]|uniref:hypothetical protein n=1 Tax=Erythrobacter sp. F6033 TaxID=2926401 RepID=UPI001FF4CEAA|nr:hypothetical protein [Erythrobacter sp. F6033]MCK0128300.1 hypothetical protein [Erythrobacter sp. F6033]